MRVPRTITFSQLLFSFGLVGLVLAIVAVFDFAMRWKHAWSRIAKLALGLSLVFAFMPRAHAQIQQTKITPDCPINLASRSTTGTSAVYDNRPQSISTAPCTEFVFVASATTTNVSFTVTVQGATDNGSTNCSTCSWSTFASLTLSAEGVVVATKSYADFLRVNLSAINSGTVTAVLNGWRANQSTAGGGGGGGGGCAVSTFPAGSVVFINPMGVCAQDVANLNWDDANGALNVNSTKGGFGVNITVTGSWTNPFYSQAAVGTFSSIDNDHGGLSIIGFADGSNGGGTCTVTTLGCVPVVIETDLTTATPAAGVPQILLLPTVNLNFHTPAGTPLLELADQSFNSPALQVDTDGGGPAVYTSTFFGAAHIVKSSGTGNTVDLFDIFDTNGTTKLLFSDNLGVLSVAGYKQGGSAVGSANAAICWKTTTTLGFCSSVVGAGGACTCN